MCAPSILSGVGCVLRGRGPSSRRAATRSPVERLVKTVVQISYRARMPLMLEVGYVESLAMPSRPIAVELPASRRFVSKA